MKLLNLGCGGNRPLDEDWINIDSLFELFPDKDVPERKQLDSEVNYMDHDLRNGLPFEDNSIDGILASQLLEHLECHEALTLTRECYRTLKPGRVLRVSIPDAGIFHTLSKDGCADWGEPNPAAPAKTFMEYALFFDGHRQILSYDALCCYLWLAGFRIYRKMDFQNSSSPKLATIDNRAKFSLFMEGIK